MGVGPRQIHPCPCLSNPLLEAGYGECLRCIRECLRALWKTGFHYEARGHGAATQLCEMEVPNQGPEITYLEQLWPRKIQGPWVENAGQLQGCRLGSGARMPSHRAEVGYGWRVGCLVPLVWSLVHCSRWLRLEEAGAIGEDSMPWQHCHMSLPWPAIFHVFLSEFDLRSNHNLTFQRFLGL